MTGVREVTRGLLLCLALSAFERTAANAAPKADADVFKQPYVYLLRGDEKFLSLASNYIHTIPTPDSMFASAIRPFGMKPSDTLPGAPHYLNISVKLPMALRVIFADSTTTNLIAFDFKSVPIGDYTLGAEDWPAPLREILAVNKRFSVFFAVDQKFQGLYWFEVNSNLKMIRVKKPTFPGN